MISGMSQMQYGMGVSGLSGLSSMYGMSATSGPSSMYGMSATSGTSGMDGMLGMMGMLMQQQLQMMMQMMQLLAGSSSTGSTGTSATTGATGNSAASSLADYYLNSMGGSGTSSGLSSTDLTAMINNYFSGADLTSGTSLASSAYYSGLSSLLSASSGSTGSGTYTNAVGSGQGVSALLTQANSMVGLNENSNTAAINQVTQKSGINCSTTPWCAAWAMNLLKDNGVLDLDGLSNRNYCPTIKNWGRNEGIWKEGGQYSPQPGDAILFDWDKDGTSDHIGIVEKVVDGNVYTIEGNSSDAVKKNSYSLSSGSIDGYLACQEQR